MRWRAVGYLRAPIVFAVLTALIGLVVPAPSSLSIASSTAQGALGQDNRSHDQDRTWEVVVAARTARDAFHGPRGLAIDRRGNLYVADSGNDRVTKLSPEGVVLTQWGGGTGGLDGFYSPAGVALDADENVYVLDHGNARVVKLSPEGVPLMQFGERGRSPGQFMSPSSVAVDPAGIVYVTTNADNAESRIQKFDPSGVLVWERQGTAGHGRLPRAVALGPDGTIYVGGSENIVALTPDGTELGSLGPHTGYFDTLAIDRHGSIYGAGTPAKSGSFPRTARSSEVGPAQAIGRFTGSRWTTKGFSTSPAYPPIRS